MKSTLAMTIHQVSKKASSNTGFLTSSYDADLPMVVQNELMEILMTREEKRNSIECWFSNKLAFASFLSYKYCSALLFIFEILSFIIYV
jgi:hypothetical protein